MFRTHLLLLAILFPSSLCAMERKDSKKSILGKIFKKGNEVSTGTKLIKSQSAPVISTMLKPTQRELLEAIEKNNADMVAQSIATLGSLNFKDDEGTSPIKAAMKNLIENYLHTDDRYSEGRKNAGTIWRAIRFTEPIKGCAEIRGSNPLETLKDIEEEIKQVPALWNMYMAMLQEKEYNSLSSYPSGNPIEPSLSDQTLGRISKPDNL